MKAILLRLAVAVSLTMLANWGWAATPDTLTETTSQQDVVEPQIWRIDGGDMRMRFNHSYLDLLGIKIKLTAAVVDKQNPEFAIFPVLSGGGLRLNAPDGGFDRFVDGALTLRGGFEISLADGSRIDLRDAKLRPSTNNPARMELVGSDGRVWVYVNHVMYVFGQDFKTFNVRSADLRASEILAKRVGELALADAYIGELKFSSRVMARSRESNAQSKGNTPNFHGAPHPSGGVYEADVEITAFTMSFMRCRRSNGATNGCDGAGADDGEVVFAPSATLRNSNNSNTADVPWYEKFSQGGSTQSPYSYPYAGNDQHPYLIWNVFRIVDDQLEQIGASGTKHAFLTTNQNCAPGAFTGQGHILGLNCSDTYGTGNNDSTNDLGPRGEILPATGVWGRCGSIFDINCDGAEDNATNISARCSEAGGSSYCQRMAIRESQMLVPEATFMSEAWYIVQDDINIYNTMARRTITPTPGGVGWIPGAQGAFVKGPAINAWVDPIANPKLNIELKSDFGRARVAVKVKALSACPAASGLSGSCYRYDYAVHNFDFATAESTSGSLPNLRVVGAKGFDKFKISVPARTTIFVEPGVNFADTDINSSNNWTASVTTGSVEWTAPVNNTLNWGTLYRFSVVSDAAPTADMVAIDLGVANPSQGLVTLGGNIVGPAGLGNGIMKDGFE